MRTFLVRRLLQTVPLLIGVSALTFLLLQLAPGDFLVTMAENPQISSATLDAMRHRFGLDQPWWVQYALYLRNVFLHFDFGESFSRHQPVFTVLRTGLAEHAAARHRSGLRDVVPRDSVRPDRRGAPAPAGPTTRSRSSRSCGFRCPRCCRGCSCWRSRRARAGSRSAACTTWTHDLYGPLQRLADLLRHLALPAIVVGLVPLAAACGRCAPACSTSCGLDYVTTARAKGLPESAVVGRHVLRNALNPMITLFGFTIGSLLSGSLVVETIFSWPGLGTLTLEAINSQDQYLVVGSVLMASVVLIAGNLVADILLAIADPRVRHD